MLGAIIGDTVGSRYEYFNTKSKSFPLFSEVSTCTDDSICTIAVAKTLIDNYPIDYDNLEKIKKDLIYNLKDFVKRYPDYGYGGKFYDWATSTNNEPYNSWGNGAGMRISPVGWIANSIDEVKKLSKAVTEVTHNHPQAIIGAQAIAMSIYLARIGKSKKEIREYIYDNYYPEINYLNYHELVRKYKFDVSCQGSVPQAIYCFLISKGFNDALRTAISIGGDSDTIGCMTGAIAEAYYMNKPSTLATIEYFDAIMVLPEEFVDIINNFLDVVKNKSYRLKRKEIKFYGNQVHFHK